MQKLCALVALLGLIPCCANTQPTQEKSAELNFGVGVGLPYGLLGISGEYFLTPRLSVSGAAGYLFDFAFDVGAQLYLYPHNDAAWNPRFSFHYGTSQQIESYNWNTGTERDYSVRDLSIGIGYKHVFGSARRHGMTIDLLHTFADDDIEHNVFESSTGRTVDIDFDPWYENLSFSIGYVFRF